MYGDVLVEISEDNMQAYVIFKRVEEDDETEIAYEIDYDAVVEILRRNKVVFGLKKEMIKDAIAEETYDKQYLVAEGVPPKDGRDASVEYKKNIEASMKPKLDEFGNVDYLNVDNYISVKAGDVLAVYTSMIKSMAGINVMGKNVKGRDVRNMPAPLGKNTAFLEDKSTIVAKIDGQLQIIAGKIVVTSVLVINNDVDTLNGNVNFIGAVKIRGNVCAGMKVKAQGSIEINGTVESAVVEAGGDIIINGGVKGMGKAIISSGGNIVTRYIETAYVKAKGDITTNSIIQSNVESDGKVSVTGSNGSIIGGKVSAANKIICKKLGSKNFSPTTVEAGLSATIQKQFDDLSERIEGLRKEIDKLNMILDMSRKSSGQKQQQAVAQINAVKPVKQAALAELEGQYEKFKEKMNINKRATISVIDIAYPEVTLFINREKFLLNSEYRGTTFNLHNGQFNIRPCENIDR